MPGGAGRVLRDLRVTRGWDRPRMARELRQAADEPLAEHRALVRMIRTWEDDEHEPSERYLLLYRRVFPAWRINGTALHSPDPGPEAILDRSRHLPSPAAIGALEDAATAAGVSRDEIKAMTGTVRELERQVGALRARLEELLGETGD